MQTSDPHIYAAGDCVEIPHRITGKKVHAPFGDLANLEGRVAGQNAVVGNRATFLGTIQTGICKIFDYTAGATGLSEKASKQNGFSDIETLVCAGLDKPGFMSGKPLITKMTVERTSGRILGAQCVGVGDVSKQIAQWAVAIQSTLTVNDLINADLPYAPPFSLAVDHMVAAIHCMENKLEGRLKTLSAETLMKKIKQKESPFMLDVRGPDEFEMTRLGLGETLIPLGALRKRLSELPSNKETEIVCYCKISLRGYEAALILEGHGYKNVRVLEGGINAWPYAKEK
jgi:rhodanese-related sulfurtransferase